METKDEVFHTLYGFCLILMAFACSPLAFPQAMPATAAQRPPEPESVAERLTPYQKSQLERMFNDWAFLAKYREADKEVVPPAVGEVRVVFMGDSITEGWGRKATATTPDRGEFFPGKP